MHLANEVNTGETCDGHHCPVGGCRIESFHIGIYSLALVTLL